jgi:probable HAF family extracellular repeat protein
VSIKFRDPISAKKGLSMTTSSTLRIAFLLSLTVSSLCAAQTYTVTDLGTLPGNGYSVARGINATGQITGAAGSNNSPNSSVFVYSNGVLTNLGTLGGTSGIGNGINASGQVAGYSQNGSGTYRAFLSNGNTLTDIGDLGGGSAVGYAINDLGQVVGAAYTADGSVHPFLYSNGHMTDLGTLGSPAGNSWWNSATGINKSGAVTGTSYDAQGNFFGFVWSNGTMKKLGTLGGSWSQGYAINNKGQVTGLAYTRNGDAHAFITINGVLKDLGLFAGQYSTTWGFGINDSGVVVGQSTFQSTYHAFVYSGGQIKDLNKLIPAKSGWVLIDANGINNAGQITGMGMHKGLEHAYLLTPH